MATAGSELGGPWTIVGVRVTHSGSDMGSVAPMLKDIKGRTGELPDILLADANCASHADVRAAAELGVEFLAAVPERSKRPGARADVDPAVVDWRTRMETDEAQRLYKTRASLCELTNARGRAHGLEHFLVRGLGKVTCVVLMAAITANILQHATTLLGSSHRPGRS